MDKKCVTAFGCAQAEEEGFFFHGLSVTVIGEKVCLQSRFTISVKIMVMLPQ